MGQGPLPSWGTCQGWGNREGFGDAAQDRGRDTDTLASHHPGKTKRSSNSAVWKAWLSCRFPSTCETQSPLSSSQCQLQPHPEQHLDGPKWLTTHVREQGEEGGLCKISVVWRTEWLYWGAGRSQGQGHWPGDWWLRAQSGDCTLGGEETHEESRGHYWSLIARGHCMRWKLQTLVAKPCLEPSIGIRKYWIKSHWGWSVRGFLTLLALEDHFANSCNVPIQGGSSCLTGLCLGGRSYRQCKLSAHLLYPFLETPYVSLVESPGVS